MESRPPAEWESASRLTYAAVTSRSFHNGMVHVLLMDGSSRAVHNSIDLRTWKALSTRAGSETVSGW